MSWSGYSPDFESAYKRRFADRVKGNPIFSEWVKEFDRWINQRKMTEYAKYPSLFDKSPEKPPTKTQVRALAYEAKQEGLTEISLKVRVVDKRTSKGYREVYRDIFTGKFVHNPYKGVQ